MIVGTLVTKTKGSTELPYVNEDYVYEVATMDWQMIRPSFLYFLNAFLPWHNSPYKKEKSILRIAEVGVAGGFNSEKMLKAYKDLHLYMIDSYVLGQDSTSAKKLTEPYKERCTLIEAPSVKTAKTFPDGFFDYVYIDAAHDYDNVYKDIEAWLPKVRLHGMMAGHDWDLPEVKRAVLAYLGDTKNPQRIFGIQDYVIDIGTNLTFPPYPTTSDWWFFNTVVTSEGIRHN